MAKNFNVLRARLAPAAIARTKARAAAELAAMDLEELRNEMGLTQTELAEALQIGQAAVSKMENRSDMLVSSLAQYVEAMGGKLRILASLPQGEVEIEMPRTTIASSEPKAHAVLRRKATA